MKYVESLRDAMYSLLDDDPTVFLIGEDIVDPYGGAFKVTKGLSVSFPGRVISTPISEAAITGAGIGLAMRGMRPIVEIMFGDFVTLAADQIINSASKFNWMYNHSVVVPLVIRLPMGGYRGYGPTHSQSLEMMFMGIPFIKIVSPSLYHNPGDLLKGSINSDDTTLFVEHKALYSMSLFPHSEARDSVIPDYSLVDSNSDFPTISLSFARDSTPDVTVIAYGHMASLAVEASRDLILEEEIIIEIVVPSLIKPIPIADFMMAIKNSRRVLILEEGCRTGGWGAEISALIQERLSHLLDSTVTRIGAKDMPIPSSRTAEEEVLPSVAGIKKEVLRVLN